VGEEGMRISPFCFFFEEMRGYDLGVKMPMSGVEGQNLLERRES